MKKILICLNIITAILLVNCPSSQAEKIFCNDGRIVSGKITGRSKNSIWIEHDLGSLGFNIGEIDKIQNDDGTISKYDYKTICSAIKNYIRGKKYAQAIELCGVLLEDFPENTQVRYLRGILNQKIGNFQETIKDYNFLIEHKAGDTGILNNLGAIYAREKRYKEAVELFILAARENPDLAEAHDNLAQLFMQTNDYNGAIAEYNKVIALDPKNTNALYNLGIAYMDKVDYSKAKEQWEKILVVKPEDIDAKNALENLKKKAGFANN